MSSTMALKPPVCNNRSALRTPCSMASYCLAASGNAPPALQQSSLARRSPYEAVACAAVLHSAVRTNPRPHPIIPGLRCEDADRIRHREVLS
jgi:hypothetical protein